MIDPKYIKMYQERFAIPLAKQAEQMDIKPVQLTLAGLASGILSAIFIAFQSPILALFFLLLSGILDSVDGCLARLTGTSSNLGAVCDIVSDRIVEFAIIFGLCLVNVEMRAIWALLLSGSNMICVTVFLVIGIFHENNSHKSFHYSPGLIERPETFALFALMILFPGAFGFFSFLFVAGTLYTAGQRVWAFYLNNSENFSFY